jgi:hypothetical protein
VQHMSSSFSKDTLEVERRQDVRHGLLLEAHERAAAAQVSAIYRVRSFSLLASYIIMRHRWLFRWAVCDCSSTLFRNVG